MKKQFVLAAITFFLGACAAQEHFAPAPQPTIRLALLPQDTLTLGKPTEVLAKLNDIKNVTVVTDDDLETAHTQKFHLLLADPTLTDYQHLHPQPTGTRGVWHFTFTPKLPGGYRAWADITPKATHKQEYVMADLGAHRAGAIDKTERHETNMNGYHFTLAFDEKPTAGDETMGTIRITDASGKPVDYLEPVMGAYAHIVGFYDDYRTVVHTHPMGEEPKTADAHGGPELMFHLEPSKPGFIKLFAQVKIHGHEIFVPFGVVVAKH